MNKPEWYRRQSINPDDPKAHYRLGYEFLNAGELEKAKTYFKGATNLDPYFLLAFKELAYVTAQLNDTENAIKHYKQSLKLDRNDKEAHHGLLELYEQAGMISEAINQSWWS
jgi:tetratricopeptide (TPR) repeat protein